MSRKGLFDSSYPVVYFAVGTTKFFFELSCAGLENYLTHFLFRCIKLHSRVKSIPILSQFQAITLNISSLGMDASETTSGESIAELRDRISALESQLSLTCHLSNASQDSLLHTRLENEQLQSQLALVTQESRRFEAAHINSLHAHRSSKMFYLQLMTQVFRIVMSLLRIC